MGEFPEHMQDKRRNIMYKKVWLGLLTAAMVTGLTACGSKAAEETTAKAAEGTDGEQDSLTVKVL